MIERHRPVQRGFESLTCLCAMPLCVLMSLPSFAFAAAVPLDLTAVSPGPISVGTVEDGVTVTWPDEDGRPWIATFSLDPDEPLVTSITVGDTPVVRLARPFYRGETGTRRRGWNAFFDFPPMWVFPLLKSLLPVVVAFLLPTTDTLDHRRVGNGTHRHGLFQEPMEELPAMA